MKVAQHLHVVLLVLEVSERGKQVAGQVKRRGTREAPHIFFDPLNRSSCLSRMLASPVQQKGRAVNSRDLETALRELDGVPPRPTAKIEQLPAAALSQSDDACDLFFCRGEPFSGKHVGIEIAPEIFALKPFHGIRVYILL